MYLNTSDLIKRKVLQVLAFSEKGLDESHESNTFCANPIYLSYLTLWDPVDCSPPGSSVHGIIQARILEWVAIYMCVVVIYIWLPGGSDRKESACNAGDPGLIPGFGRYPRQRNGYPSNILAWRIPLTEEYGGLQSMGCQRVGHD